jgi:hypothetical protein
MTTWFDTDGGPTCGDCIHGCPRPPYWEACDVDGCRCPCRTGEGVDPDRAAELDDRPADKLAVIAADMEAERVPTLAELRIERFGVTGLPRWGAA